jgi:imidazolonepropionase
MRDLIVRAKQLLTLSGPKHPRTGEYAGELGIIEDGAVAIDDGRISEVGKASEVGNEAREIIEWHGLAMPGFVDPHTHAVFSGSREDELKMKIEGKSYLEILKAGGGILRTVRATRKASFNQLYLETKRRADTMLLYGTTTAEMKSGYGLDMENEIKMLEVIEKLNNEHPMDIIPTFLGAHALPPEFSDANEYIDFLIDAVIPEVAERKLARFADIFCEKDVFDVEQSRKYLSAAKRYGMVPKIHADEIENLGGVRVGAEVGAISAEHLVRTSDEEMDLMAEKGMIADLLPGTPHMLLSNDYAPARKFIEKGVPVALATDLNPNCWTESMQMIVNLASLRMRMGPEEAIVSATINAAYSIGMGDEVGSLENGKKADIILLDVPNYMHIPYHFGINLVNTVIKEGRVVVKDGKIRL